MRRFIQWFWRGSEAELGDALEEFPQKGSLWLLRQSMSYRRSIMLTNFWSDLRYAARGLRNNPGFTAAAVLAIALGIGINTGIFSVLNGLALRDLDSPVAAQLNSIHQILQNAKGRSTHGTRSMVSMTEFGAYRVQTPSLHSLTGYAPFWEMTLGGETPVKVNGDLVACNYFTTLQLPMTMGSGFTAENCSDSATSSSIVLSHDLWRNQFGADPDILGRAITLNRISLRVVGVAAENFHGVEVYPARFFAPLATQPQLYAIDYFHQANTGWIQMVGRRGADVSEDRLRSDLNVVAARLDKQRDAGTTTVQVTRTTPFSMPEVRRTLLAVGAVILTAFGLVLLIACANVANLLLARAAGRTKEIVVRLAVGASRARLMQQLLVESLLLATIGGLLGSALALWSFRSLVAILPAYLPPDVPGLHLDTSPDQRVLLFAFLLTLATGIAFGLVPALIASKRDLASGMKQDSAGSGRRSRGGLRGALVGVQIAVCTVLLVASGLLLRGLYAAQTLDPGFIYENNYSVSYDLRGGGYDGAKSVAFQSRLLEQLRWRFGEHSVAQAEDTPLNPGNSASLFGVPGRAPEQVEVNWVTADYFDLIGTPIVMGRTFEEGDGERRGIVVNEGGARHFWPGRNPVGQTLNIDVGRGKFEALTVVGVAKDAQLIESSPASTPYIYFHPRQESQLFLGLMVRGRDGLAGTAAIVRQEAAQLDPGLIVNVAPLRQNLDFWSSAAQLIAGLSGSLGVLALVLSVIGVYGVVSYTVSRRVREFGIRMVMGANKTQLRLMILKQALRPVFIGAAVGLLLSLGVARVLESVLFGVSSHDPIAFSGAAIFLVCVAALASLIPTRRATNVDPMTTLRYE
jgi:predicted permease